MAVPPGCFLRPYPSCRWCRMLQSCKGAYTSKLHAHERVYVRAPHKDFRPLQTSIGCSWGYKTQYAQPLGHVTSRGLRNTFDWTCKPHTPHSSAAKLLGESRFAQLNRARLVCMAWHSKNTQIHADISPGKRPEVAPWFSAYGVCVPLRKGFALTANNMLPFQLSLSERTSAQPLMDFRFQLLARSIFHCPACRFPRLKSCTAPANRKAAASQSGGAGPQV